VLSSSSGSIVVERCARRVGRAPPHHAPHVTRTQDRHQTATRHTTRNTQERGTVGGEA
jgi:hypothetical protein